MFQIKINTDTNLNNRLMQCINYIQLAKGTQSNPKELTLSPAIKNLLPLIKFYVVESETSFTDCIANVYICSKHMQLPAKQLAFIICHEICHILFLHSLRASDYEYNEYHYEWNMATDYFINSLLETYKHVLEVPKLTDEEGNPVEICLNKKYSHLNTGEELILKELIKERHKIPSSGKGKGSGQPSKNGKDFSGGIDSHGTWISDNEQDTDAKIRINAIKKAIEDLQKEAENDIRIGTEDVILNRLSAIYISKENDWEKKLKFYLVKTFERATKYNYHRNARNNLTEYFLPATQKLKKTKPKFLFAIDTSMSVTDKQLALFKGEIFRVIKAGGQVDFLSCHTKITALYEDATLKDVSDFNIGETGGTDFNPVFEYAKIRKHKYDLIVYLTDGFGIFDYHKYPEFKKNTLWLINCGGNKKNALQGVNYVQNSFPNFGKIIPIA